MNVVGIAGKAHCGKDTLATWLVQNRGAFSTSFALPLKMAICVAFTLPIEVFDQGRKEQIIPWIGQSPRHLAQTLGTEWGRATVREDIWVRATEQLLESQGLEANRIVVIPDVRFENEAAFVRKHGLLIHLYRDGADGQVGIQGHASESGVIPQTTDLAITNNGSLDDLYGKLGAIFPRPVR